MQVFAKDASHGLSLEKLEYNLNKKHPRVHKKDPETRKITYTPHAWCGTNIGIHLCCKSMRKTELAPYGVGIALYFQFLKHMIYTFFLLSILSVPSYIFFYSGNSSGVAALDNIKNTLTAFSLGNIGQSAYACNSAQLDQAKNQINVTLFCSYGYLAEIETLGQSLVT